VSDFPDHYRLGHPQADRYCRPGHRHVSSRSYGIGRLLIVEHPTGDLGTGCVRPTDSATDLFGTQLSVLTLGPDGPNVLGFWSETPSKLASPIASPGHGSFTYTADNLPVGAVYSCKV